MKIAIDTNTKLLTYQDGNDTKELHLFSDEAFEILSDVWLKAGWAQKYTYTFSWMGRPIIQLPEDMVRIQEVIYRVQPDVIIETGVAHGGSLIFYASLCKALDKGRVIGIDIHIRPHNRTAIESHPLYPLITLIEGSSTDQAVVNQVKSLVRPGETVLVVLDSRHTKQHVFDELEAYYDLVTPNSYLVATDGIMQDLHDAPRGDESWSWDHPAAAAAAFAQQHAEFVLEQPDWPFNESTLSKNVTYWPGAWLRRHKQS